MLDRYGMAVMEERHHDRRFAGVQDYLRTEYGSTSGMERYIAEAKGTSFPRSGLRAFLAKIAGLVARPKTQVTTTAASVERALSEEGAEHATPVAHVAPAPQARPARYRGRLNVQPRTVLPALKR